MQMRPAHAPVMSLSEAVDLRMRAASGASKQLPAVMSEVLGRLWQMFWAQALLPHIHAVEGAGLCQVWRRLRSHHCRLLLHLPLPADWRCRRCGGACDSWHLKQVESCQLTISVRRCFLLEKVVYSGRIGHPSNDSNADLHCERSLPQGKLLQALPCPKLWSQAVSPVTIV